MRIIFACLGFPLQFLNGGLIIQTHLIFPVAGQDVEIVGDTQYPRPIQLKSNCGTLVIDDFGRQRMTTDELLNRWIVPLEKRYDFLNLASGKKIQVPFDQLIVFSTNLEPRDLVDEAFLRRIPYKIEVIDPTESEFRELFQMLCPAMNIPFNTESLDYLIETHYKKANRPFRCCHPRDILLQVRNYCQYREQEHVLSFDNLDFAVSTYFAAV